MIANKWYCIAQTGTFDSGCTINVSFDSYVIQFSASVKYGSSAINITRCELPLSANLSLRLRESNGLWSVDLLSNNDISPEIVVADSPYWVAVNSVAGAGNIILTLKDISKDFNTGTGGSGGGLNENELRAFLDKYGYTQARDFWKYETISGGAIHTNYHIIVDGGGAFGGAELGGGGESGGGGISEFYIQLGEGGQKYKLGNSGLPNVVQIPKYPVVPTNVSEFYNDAGYIGGEQAALIFSRIGEVEARVEKLEKLWWVDENGNLHTTYNIVVEKGGAFGTGASVDAGGSGGLGRVILVNDSGNEFASDENGIVRIPDYINKVWFDAQNFASQSWVLSKGYVSDSALAPIREDITTLKKDVADLKGMWTIKDGKLYTTYSIVVEGGGAFGQGASDSGEVGVGKTILITPSGLRYETNDDGYVPIPEWASQDWVNGKGFATQTWVLSKGFLTENSADLLYAKKAELDDINEALAELVKMWRLEDGKLFTDYSIIVKGGGSFGQGSESGGGSAGGLGQIIIRNQAGQEYKTDANGVVVIPTYLTSTALDGYATQQWVEGQKYLKSIPAEYITEDELTAKGYALSSDLTKVGDRVATLEGNFNGAVAKEAAKVSNALTFGNKTYDGSAAQSILASDLDAVTLSGEQIITGAKTFSSLITANSGIKIPRTASLKIGDITLIEEDGALKVLGNLVVTGGGAFGQGATTGGGGGEGFSKIIIQTEGGQSYTTNDAGVVTIPNYITSAALNGYATETFVNNRVNALINGAPAAYDTLKEIADVLAGNVNSIGDIITTLGTKADKATTLAGYGITDAKITSGVITLGANTIKPLTSHQTIYALTVNNSAGTTQITYTPNSKAASLTLTKAMVGLSNVENTALSTWAGSTKITTLGTITSGTWNGTKIANGYLANSSMTIAGTSVSLGGSISVATLQSNLGLKALAYKDYLEASDIPDISATYVTVGTSQTISGTKTFSASIAANGGIVIPSTKSLKIGEVELTWDGKALRINKNLVVLGGGAFGEGATSGGGTSGGLGSVTIKTEGGIEYKSNSNGVVTVPNWITAASLNGYATQAWVEGKKYITGITSSMVTTALGYTPLSTGGGTITGDLNLTTNLTLAYNRGALLIATQYGGSWFGMMNSGYCHIYTEAPAFYMDKPLYVDNGNVVIHSGNYSDYAYPKNGSGYLSFDANGRPVMRNNQGYAAKNNSGGIEEILWMDNNNVVVIGGTSSTDVYLYDYNPSCLSGALIHSGNIGDYAVKCYGTDMPSDIVNYVGFGKLSGWVNYGPAFSFGISNYYTQIQRAYNSNEIYVRGYYEGIYTDWKTIAFTDSNVASADYATSAGNANALNGISSKNYAYYGIGTGYLGFNINDYALAPYGQGDGYIEYYDNGAYYNSVWGWVMAVNGFKGNADSATKLQTARTIWGQSFDGTYNIDTTTYGMMRWLYFSNSSGVEQGYVGRGAETNDIYLATYGENSLRFTTNSTIRATITPSGNVLIGTTTDNGHKLQVTGAVSLDNVVLANTSSALLVQTPSGNSWFGMMNTSYCHIYTDAYQFYMDKGLNAATLYSRGDLEAAGNLIVTGGGAFGSDVRYKDIISYRQLDLETIVNAPLFTYQWNDREDKKVYLGTSAQYWMETTFKDAVNTSNLNFYHLDYGALAVGIGISVAREVKGVKTDIKGVKTEVEQLREEVKQLKEKLNKYETLWHN